MTLIEAKELTKTFRGKVAVDHVSLNVTRGEVVGFLGPNGAGKSTTMKMIAGFLEPDEGQVSVCGYDVQSDTKKAQAHIGYLPEGAPAYGDMVVGDFLAFAGKMRHMPKRALNDRLADMAEQIGLADVWDQQIETLSKGYKRRVGIAQALINDPDVLILDEPTDGLDPNQKHEMRNLIRSISTDKGIIVSTHILEEVEAVCTRAVIIANGKVLADETPHDLVARPAKKDAIRLTVASKQTEELLAKIRPLVHDANIEVVERFDGLTSFLITQSGQSSSPAHLASQLAQAQVDVEDIGIYRPSLEDVFREITQDRLH